MQSEKRKQDSSDQEMTKDEREKKTRALSVSVALMAVAVIAFCLGTVWSSPKTVSASGEAGVNGRYEIIQTEVPYWDYRKVPAGEKMPATFLLDTVTGRTWTFAGPSTAKDGSLIDAGGWDEQFFPLRVLGKASPRLFNTPSEYDSAVAAMKRQTAPQ